MEDLPPVFVKLKAFTEMFTEDEIKAILGASYKDVNVELDFESFLRVSRCYMVVVCLFIYS